LQHCGRSGSPHGATGSLDSIEQYPADIQKFPRASGYGGGMSLTLSQRRRLAAVFAFCSVAILLLLANHPMDAAAAAVADLIRAEARNRLLDGVIHGGFVAISSILIVCFVLLSRLLGLHRVAVVIGLVAFCLGSGALMASMTVDGLVVPAIAVRFLGPGTSDALSMAKALFIFCASVIRVLMPMGLTFEALAMLSWSVVIAGRAPRRLAGLFGIAAGVSVVGATFLLPDLGRHLLIGAIVLLCIWYLTLARILWVRDGLPANATGRTWLVRRSGPLLP
jgi:hypothetical protein